MKQSFTSRELQGLAEGLQQLFETVVITDPAENDEAEPGGANGLRVRYELQLDRICCILTQRITVDGAEKLLHLSSPLAGSVIPENELTARELQMYRDDMVRDFLSGAYNRRYWETSFCSRIAAWNAEGRPVAVALVSIDDFDAIASREGRPNADQLICYVANQWKKYYDEGDEKVVCRLTGHIFAVGCVGAEELDLESQMRVIYEKMRCICVSTCGMLRRIPFTLSIACAGTNEVANPSWTSLYALCDERLRDVMEAGGNAVAEPKEPVTINA